MPYILALLGIGSAIIAFTVSWQVKHVTPDFISVAKYNFFIIPILFIANTSLGLGFIKGHQLVKNLPLLIASQTFIYYLMIIFFSIYLVEDKVSFYRAIIAFSLMAFSIWLLKS
ncbi:MAG: hypothetical protein PWQ67_1456 [Clostridia bacterium]|jgi:hypothetical protein|nr:hypothetical protein [Clostridia bacterium]MDN5323002.1 hypothetical protein [Clostridia bacterium]